MKTRIFTISILIIVISTSGYGQKTNLLPGFIITNSNDTLRGVLDYKSNAQNSMSCTFINGIANTRHTYSPEDIKAFKIENNKYYVAKDITIDGTKSRVFLEYLVDGIVDLYYLSDAFNEYYFIENDTSMIQLSNKETKVFRKGDGIRTNDKEFTSHSNQYKGALRYAFKDSPGLSDKITNTAFEYKALVRITKEYHESVCRDYSCIDFTRSTKQKIYLEPCLGMINTWMGLKTSEDHVRDISPAFGMQLRFISFKGLTSWNVLLGLNYSSNKFEGDFDNDLFTYSNTKTYHIYTGYSVLRLPVTIQYLVPAKRLQPYFNLGYVNVFLLNIKTVSIQTGDGYNLEQITDEIPDYEYGITAGLGLKYNLKNGSYILLNNAFEYRLSFSPNTSDALDYLNHKSWILNVGYGFAL